MSRLARESSNYSDFGKFEKKLVTDGVRKAKFKYKSNPMDNPKVVKDVIENPDATK